MGKTTILRLVFHLLSPENNRGHRNFLRDTHFEIIEVKLFSGVTVSARHEDPLKRSVLILQNKERGETLVTWTFRKRSKETRGRDDQALYLPPEIWINDIATTDSNRFKTHRSDEEEVF